MGSRLACGMTLVADHKPLPPPARASRTLCPSPSAAPRLPFSQRQQARSVKVQAQRTAEESQEATTAAPTSSTPGGNAAMDTLSRLVGVLLVNASSLREERGLAHCLQCKGTGTVECKGCKGKGVLPSSKVQRHSVKRMVSQLEGMVGIGSPIAHDSNWQMSNRCQKCRGTGRCVCSACQGAGARAPQR